MQDFSQFVGGQCEIQVNLSEREGRRTYKGNIKSIQVTESAIDIYFDWLASWSLEDGFWTILSPSSNDHHVKIPLDNPSKMRLVGPNYGGMFMIDISSMDQFLLLYPKGYRGTPNPLNRAKVEENQKRRAKLEAEFNAAASGYSHRDDTLI